MSRALRLVVAAFTAGTILTGPAPGAIGPVLDCAALRARNWRPAIGVPDPSGEVRVVAVQYKQEIRYAESYETFRDKMECLIKDFVPPDRSVPTIVVLNEDIGLATLGIGTRGAAARAIAASPIKDPGTLAGAIGAFAAVGASYAPQIAFYAAREPETSPQRLILAAATDTMVRAFMDTFSDLARQYGVYIVASNNQAEFREVNVEQTPVLIDPDLAPLYASGALTTVYEAVDSAGPGQTDDDASFDVHAGSGLGGINVHNKAFMWSPNPGVEPYADERFGRFALDGAHLTAADPRSNLIAVTKKTPVTQIEKDLLDITDDGDLSVENAGPFPLDESPLPDAVKIGFGISLPAFMWGNDFGEEFAGDGCLDRDTWMRCLDQRGVSLFLQPEANPGAWATYADSSRWNPPAFQALSWLNSAWRAVADPSVTNIRYAVTPFMVGNLIDLPFDGQSTIFERCIPTGGGDTCDPNTAATHIGADDFIPCLPQRVDHCDDPDLAGYAGGKRETIALAGWVMQEDALLDAWQNREAFVERSRAMLAGSGSPFENDYLETAIWADLDFD